MRRRDRSISRRQCAIAGRSTASVPLVERDRGRAATAGPTASRHAKSTFSGVERARAAAQRGAGSTTECANQVIRSVDFTGSRRVYHRALRSCDLVARRLARRRAAPSCCSAAGLSVLCVCPADVDEYGAGPSERPDDYVRRLARGEGARGRAARRRRTRSMLGADTTVVVDGDDPREAGRRGARPRACCGGWPAASHQVLTGVASVAAGASRDAVEVTARRRSRR